MKVFHCDQFTYPLPAGHRFPAVKYSLLRERVADELTPPCELLVPDAASDGQLLRAHTIEYLAKVVNGTLTDREVRRIGLPWSPELVERSRRSVGGTIEACRGALLDGIAVSLSGGTHHAFPDHGAGYCIFNDVAVAVRTLQAEGRARRIVVVDCDVHQGDGTAAIFAGDSSVFTFSIHGAKNFPLHKERSDLDVELPDATGDADYLNALEIGLGTQPGPGVRRPGDLPCRRRPIRGRYPGPVGAHQGWAGRRGIDLYSTNAAAPGCRWRS